MDRFFSNLGVSPSLLHIAGMLTLYSITIIYKIASQLQNITPEARDNKQAQVAFIIM